MDLVVLSVIVFIFEKWSIVEVCFLYVLVGIKYLDGLWYILINVMVILRSGF